MVIDNVIDFDESRELLRWGSEGVRNELFQHNGLDIALIQKIGEQEKGFSPYSSPAHEFFACLMRYLKEKGNFPGLEQFDTIKGIQGRDSNYCDGLASAKRLIMFQFEGRLPFFNDGKIKVTATGASINLGNIGISVIGGQIGYTGYVHDEDFIVGMNCEQGIEIVAGDKEVNMGHVQEHIILDQVDVLNVMKGIYYFSPNKEVLREFHQAAKVHNNS